MIGDDVQSSTLFPPDLFSMFQAKFKQCVDNGLGLAGMFGEVVDKVCRMQSVHLPPSNSRASLNASILSLQAVLSL